MTLVLVFVFAKRTKESTRGAACGQGSIVLDESTSAKSWHLLPAPDGEVDDPVTKQRVNLLQLPRNLAASSSARGLVAGLPLVACADFDMILLSIRRRRHAVLSVFGEI